MGLISGTSQTEDRNAEHEYFLSVERKSSHAQHHGMEHYTRMLLEMAALEATISQEHPLPCEWVSECLALLDEKHPSMEERRCRASVTASLVRVYIVSTTTRSPITQSSSPSILAHTA